MLYRNGPASFWALVEQASDGCWLWRGHIEASGYGSLKWAGEAGQRRNVKAHVVAYELVVGPVPRGLELDHLCRNRGCVRPDHLEPVTHAENVRRAFATKTACRNGHPYMGDNLVINKAGARTCRICKNRQSRERKWRLRARHGPLLGAANHKAKLTEDDVRAIRAQSGTNVAVAKQYGVSDQMVSAIRARRSWTHVI